MSLEVQCGGCSARFTLPDDLYERKVRGRIVTVRCKKCRADISVDGTENGAVIDETPTEQMPISLPPVAGLWVVGFGDDDDRELTVGQIKKALDAGEITRETLVWNPNLDEWLMLGEAAGLKDLVTGDEVGGFLGTGVDVSASVDLQGSDEIGPFKSAGAGTMSDRPTDGEEPSADEASSETKPAAPEPVEKLESPPVDGTPTLPLVMPSKASTDGGGPPPKPHRHLPDAPAKLRPAWLSDEEPKRSPPATEDPDLPDGEEESPSSGTPDLRTLMSESIAPPKREKADKNETVSEEIFAIGGGGIAAALPTIDLAAIKPAPPSDPEASKLDPDGAPAGSKRSPKRERSGSKGRKRSPSSLRPAAASAAPVEAKSDSSMMWIFVAAIGALAAYWFLIRSPDPSSSTQTPAPTTPATVVTPPPELTQPLALDAAPAPQADADPTRTETTPTEPKETTPTEPKETTPTEPKETTPTEPKETKPSPSAKGPDVAMAAPFDANAARAALSSAAGAASSCRKEGDPPGTATVVVTFAPSGRVTSANISGPPFAGTQTGGCIASAMRGAKVPAFSGEHMTVSKTVVIQ